ncbi:MAG TPA: flagellar hook assembly protein FlgD [Candidatus Binatia bacterium]|nr:flagellar hook assembly protein FlgD [Candidatus Binatia bacterium]
MTTTPVENASAHTAALETATAQNQTVSQQQFLTLFVAQLRNQDPLNPQDPSEMTSQLAQFSSLEQLTGVNTRLDALAGTLKQSTTSALLGMIGKSVAFDGGKIGVQKGQAPEVAYTLDAAADRVTVTVRDANGKTVRSVALGAQGVGAHTFRFDGRDANGLVVPDGTYTVEVSAVRNKTATPVALEATAKVEGVDLSGDVPALLVGGRRVGLDEIHQVKDS